MPNSSLCWEKCRKSLCSSNYGPLRFLEPRKCGRYGGILNKKCSLTIGASHEFDRTFCKHFAGACAHHTLGCSTYITIKNSLDTSLSDLDPDWIILSVWVYLYTKIISHVTMYTHTICIHIQYVYIYMLIMYIHIFIY